MKPYTVTIDAVSKSFAATGLRVGWAFGPESLLARMRALISHTGAWAPMPEQKGVASFLGDPEGVYRWLQGFRQILAERLNDLHRAIIRLREAGYPVDALAPEASIYLSMQVNVPNARRLLLEKGGIGVLPLEVFGAPAGTPWYRISVGACAPEEIGRFAGRLALALNAHQSEHHLKKIKHMPTQDYGAYTAQDQETWRKLFTRQIPAVERSGILSSISETAYAVSGKPRLVPFHVQKIVETPYIKDAIQEQYFVARSLQELSGSLPDLQRAVERLPAG